MAKYAYSSSERKSNQIIYAKDLKNNNNWYFCPNPMCDAHLWLVSQDGEVIPHFRAKESNFRHINGCYIKNSNPRNLPWDTVNVNTHFFDDLMSATKFKQGVNPRNRNGETKANKLNSISAHYNLLIDEGPNYYVEGYDCQIGDLVYTVANQKEINAIDGGKVVEVKNIAYNKLNNEITVGFPFNNPRINITLRILDESLYVELKEKAYNQYPNPFIIGGIFYNNTLNIRNKRQFHML